MWDHIYVFQISPTKISYEYVVEDNSLIKHIDGKIIEFNDSYFIIEVSNMVRDDLLDFDVVASSNELLDKINVKSPSAMMEYNDLIKSSNDFKIIQLLMHDTSQNIKNTLYQHLQPSTQAWFTKNYILSHNT